MGRAVRGGVLVALALAVGSCRDQGPRYAWDAAGRWEGAVDGDALTLRLAESGVQQPNAVLSGDGVWRADGEEYPVLLDAGNRTMRGELFNDAGRVTITLRHP